MATIPGNYKSRLYYERLVNQKCPRCGSDRDNFYIKCSKCRAKANQTRLTQSIKDSNHRSSLKQRNKYIRSGLCRCSRQIDDTRFVQCSICRSNSLKRWYKKYRNKQEGNKKEDFNGLNRS